jgi:hypothetical protein
MGSLLPAAFQFGGRCLAVPFRASRGISVSLKPEGERDSSARSVFRNHSAAMFEYSRLAFDGAGRDDPSGIFAFLLSSSWICFSVSPVKHSREPPRQTRGERTRSRAGSRVPLRRTKSWFGKVFSRRSSTTASDFEITDRSLYRRLARHDRYCVVRAKKWAAP